jgi:hypothetical protein
MLQPKPVQTAQEFFAELFLRWKKKLHQHFINTAWSDDEGEYESIRRARPRVRAGTWFLYQNEDADDASKLYEKGNE